MTAQNEVQVAIDEPFAVPGREEWMARQAARVLESEGMHGCALSVLVTDDETVRTLNREHRHEDKPTDVLSFGLTELAKPAVDDEEPFPEFVLPPDVPRPLGDVVIAYPTAERQAAEHGRAVDHELAHLLIHGILHILGYDHYLPEEERAMRAREEALLAERLWTT
jgi:probable rRNA maturation factor